MAKRSTLRFVKTDSTKLSQNHNIPEKFIHERINVKELVPLTVTQGNYIQALNTSSQVIVLGPAGTGKSFIAGTHAADMLRKGKIYKIVLTRPNVPGGRSLGFFPGSMEEKVAPWMVPLTETIRNRIGVAAYEIALKNGTIEIVPFEVMRGRTFKDCIVILDEAQNTTIQEIKMMMTRIGDDCQVIINGDISQSDLKESSGLSKIIHLSKKYTLPIPIIEFTLDDIVRSGICEMWVRAFTNEKL